MVTRRHAPRLLAARPLGWILAVLAGVSVVAACGDDSTGTGGAGSGSGGAGPGSGGGATTTATTTSQASTSATTTGSSSSAGGAGGEGTGGGDTGGGGSGLGQPPDLENGTFVFENVSNTPGTLSHDGRIAVLEDGTAVAVWSEPDEVETFDQDIVSRAWDGRSWGALEALTDDVEVQNAFPSLVADGNELLLLWNGYPEGFNDIYGSRRGGGSWEPRENLTLPFEAKGAPRTDYDPSIARSPGPGGDLAASFLSYPVDLGGGAIGPTDVLAFVDGEPGLVIATEDGSDCTATTSAFDADGSTVVVAACGGFGGSQLWLARRTDGDWSAPVALTEGADDDRAVLALGEDGLHIGFVRFAGCDQGDVCVVHALLEGAELVGTVEVDGDHDGAFAPALAVDPWGRTLMTFHAFDDGGFGDVYLVHAEAGGTFSAPRNVTPGTPDSDEWFPEAIAFGPDGAPWILYEGIVPDSDPLDEEIYLARLVP